MRDFSNNTKDFGLNTATLGHNIDGAGAGWSPEEVIDLCAQKGLGSITFWDREFKHDAQHIGDYAKGAGIEISSLCRAPFLVGPLAATTREQVLDGFFRVIDMGAALNAHSVVVCVGGVVPDSHDMQYSLDQVSEIMATAAERADRAGVKLALEPLHPVYAGDRSCLVTIRDTVDMIEGINHSAVGVAIDVYHVWWDLTLGDQLQRLNPEQILGYHLCDWLANTTDVLLDRGMMGDGVANLRRIRQAVESAGYQGSCEVEIFSSQNWWKRDPEEVLDICIQRFQNVC
ncbi:MAG: sugar phosphate isomerase/epimerase [Granulosicoccus sp.]|nr:sugar phosphate isomerase/epimerase [Granulosicoccus sp.]